MRVVHINTFPHKATGAVMFSVHEYLLSQNEESYVIWGRGRRPSNNNEYTIEDKIGTILHGGMTRLFDRTGFGSTRATKKLITLLDRLKPDIVHLHNLHGYYINISLLFGYLQRTHIKTVWTLHDCWAITGHCVYFDAVNCNRWQSGCYHCPQKRTYPSSILMDNSLKNWKDKKKLTENLDLTIVTVSQWLKQIVDQSFLKNHSVVVIPNGISKEDYYPVSNTIKERFGIGSKKMILSVANEWTERKGLQDIVKLSNILPETEYSIVVIGLSKKQIKTLDHKIIGLERTNCKKELLEFYSAADIYFNASIEETMGMTTVEAISCGTIPIVYNATALPEVLNYDKRFIAEKRNVEQVADMIQHIDWSLYGEYLKSIDISRYSKNAMVKQYYQLYLKLCGKEEHYE